MASAADRLMDHIRDLVDPGQRMSGTDGQLLARWLTGHDNRAFSALVARHGALVWRVGRNVLHQREDAEDVFQATFMVLARKAASLQKHSSIAGWLYQTAYHLALKARTKAIGRARRDRQAGPKVTVDLLEELSVREARLILGEELNRLPAAYRETLLLCLYEGATQNEAARQLSCSLNTVKRRLERGRALLGRRLSRRGLAPTIALALTLCSRSEIPAQLTRLTIAAATQFAARQALTGSAVVLAEGLLRTLILKKVAVYFTFLLAVSGMTAAGGFALTRAQPTAVASGSPLPQLRAAAQAVLTKGPAPRLDVNGDPLPPGAVNRIGSSRFRHDGEFGTLLYTPDGKSIASTSSDYNLRLWDASTGKVRWQLEMGEKRYNPALAVSSDGKKLAMLLSFEYVEIASATGRILLQHKWPEEENADFVRCKAISPYLDILARGCFDGTVRLHDAATGKETMRIIVGDKAQGQFPLLVEFSADGKKICVLNSKKSALMIFDTKTGEKVKALNIATTPAPPNHLIHSHKHHLLAGIYGGQVVLWDLAAGKQRQRIQSNLTGCGAFSPDDRLIAVGGLSPEIVLVDAASGQEQRRFGTYSTWNCMAFSPDGKTLASGNYFGCITLWDVATGKPIAPSPEPKGFSSIRFANNGKQMHLFGYDVELWNVSPAERVRRLPRDPKWTEIQSLSPNGKLLAAPALNGEMELVDASNGARFHTFLSGAKFTAATLFSPDGTKLFSAGMSDPGMFIWNVATGRALYKLHQLVYADKLAVSPDGHRLASAACNYPKRRDYGIRIWDVDTGKLLHVLPRRSPTNAMIFSPDSSRLISVGGDWHSDSSADASLWDVATGKLIRAFTGHTGYISCVAMTADGRMIATGSNDKSLRLWEVATGKERTRIPGHEAPVFSVDFSRNGRLLAAASNDAPVYIWDAYAPPNLKLTTGKLLKQDREKLWQALVDADAAIGFRAICELIAHPSEASAMLEGGWKQMPRATPKQMRAWVDDLSSEQFTVRKTATAELERFAAAHEGLLRDSLKQAGSLEARQRLEQILGRTNPEGLRRSRMLEVLEQLHTAPARRFLQTLAEQKEDTAMAREAAAGLKRSLSTGSFMNRR